MTVINYSPMPAESVIDHSLFVSLTPPDDKTLTFSVYRALRVCKSQTKVCIGCSFDQALATCFENLVKHLEFVIRQLEPLNPRIGWRKKTRKKSGSCSVR